MMNQTLLGNVFPRRRPVSGPSARVAAMFTLAMVLGCACATTLAAAAPTKTRTAHVRKGAALVETSRPIAKRAKASAVRETHARPGAKSAARPGVGSSAKSGGKHAAMRPGAKAKSADVRPLERNTPRRKGKHQGREFDEPVDMPTMYRARMGRGAFGHGGRIEIRGRRQMVLALRGRPSLFTAEVSASPLRGTHEVLVHQNLMAMGEGLERIQDDADLDRLRASNQLVDFTPSRSLHINPELPDNRRCARVWTVQFADDLAREFFAKFGEPLEVNSAARSIEYQRRLGRINGNAAGIEGEAASPHLSGQAIDLGKRGMSHAELTWMRERLLPMMQSGKIDVEEEFRQACFHISVYKSYLPPVIKHELAQVEPTAPIDDPSIEP